MNSYRKRCISLHYAAFTYHVRRQLLFLWARYFKTNGRECRMRVDEFCLVNIYDYNLQYKRALKQTHAFCYCKPNKSIVIKPILFTWAVDYNISLQGPLGQHNINQQAPNGPCQSITTVFVQQLYYLTEYALQFRFLYRVYRHQMQQHLAYEDVNYDGNNKVPYFWSPKHHYWWIYFHSQRCDEPLSLPETTSVQWREISSHSQTSQKSPGSCFRMPQPSRDPTNLSIAFILTMVTWSIRLLVTALWIEMLTV